MTKIHAAIAGVHGYVPDYILTNEIMSSMVDTNDEWITTRTGIKERRILKGKNQGSSVMAIEAVKGLLAKTNTNIEAIDMLICATTTPDLIFPATATIIANAVGIKNAAAYDLQAACTGFLYALETASQFIETGKYKNIIVIGVDKMSSIVDYEDRSTCILFGDGAGAVLLTPHYENLGIIDSFLQTDGSGEKYLYQKAGGSRNPASHETVKAKEHFLYQDGKTVFKIAVNNMFDAVCHIIKKNQLHIKDIDFLVPHQANQRIIQMIGQKLGIAPEKVMVTIDKFGNTSAATLPLCLWVYESQLKKGDQLILTAFGGGFSWGAIYITWSYG